LIAGRSHSLNFGVLVIFLDQPPAADHHGRACVGSHQNIGDHLDQRKLVGVVDQLAFKVGLVEVNSLLLPCFFLLLLFVFPLSAKNVTKFITELLF